MINSFVSRRVRARSFAGDLIVSAAGCFLFMPAFRTLTAGSDRSDLRLSAWNTAASPRPLAGVYAAFFLLSFIASEALATIRALGH
jgi:hypothetical protein